MAMWIGVLCSTNGLLLIIAAILAYETRQVRVNGLNDTRYIAVSIYNVVLLGSIAVPLAVGFRLHQDYPYLTISTLIIYCTSLSLVLFFIILVSLFQCFLHF